MAQGKKVSRSKLKAESRPASSGRRRSVGHHVARHQFRSAPVKFAPNGRRRVFPGRRIVGIVTTGEGIHNLPDPGHRALKGISEEEQGAGVARTVRWDYRGRDHAQRFPGAAYQDDKRQ